MAYDVAGWWQKCFKALAVGVWGLFAHISVGLEAEETNAEFLLFLSYGL